MNIFNKNMPFKGLETRPYDYKKVELQLLSYVKKDVDQGLWCINKFLKRLNQGCVGRGANYVATEHLSFKNNLKGGLVKTGTDGFKPRGSFALAEGLNFKTLKYKSPPSQRTHKFTVIRSPFIFKKTREQFGLIQHGLTLKVYLEDHEQNLLLNLLGLLRLPCECKVKSWV